MIYLEIPRIPVPWTAPKVGKGRRLYNPRAKEKLLTQWLIKNSFQGIRLDGFVVLELLFEEPVPASTSKKNKALMLSGEIIPTRCDNTNLQKFYEDCLKDIVFKDDRYVAKNISTKLYGDKGRILVKIWTLSEYRNLNENCTR